MIFASNWGYKTFHNFVTNKATIEINTFLSSALIADSNDINISIICEEIKKLLFFFFNFQPQFFFIDFENYIILKYSLIPTPCEKMSKNEQKVTKLQPLQNSSPIILVQKIILFLEQF